jgi:hypothetical protein
MWLSRARFTIRWMMARIAVLAFTFLVIPHLKSWADLGAVIVMLTAYAGIEVALRPDPGPSEQGSNL